jgi:hypothetical protein
MANTSARRRIPLDLVIVLKQPARDQGLLNLFLPSLRVLPSLRGDQRGTASATSSGKFDGHRPFSLSEAYELGENEM